MSTIVEAVRAEGIWKTYPGGIVANRDVSISVRQGEILALLGENGAGKTTLVNIIAGILAPDKGSLYVYGRKVRFHGPSDALRYGISLVPQNPRLIESFTVAENIVLAARLAGIKLTLGQVRDAARSVGEEYGIAVDPDAYVWSLSMGERQRAEIVKALVLGAKILLLDEPTTHLSPLESSKLLELTRTLSSQGKSIVFITHRINEALEVADRIAVMRSGRLVALLARGEADREKVLELMFGAERLAEPAGPRGAGRGSVGRVVLEVRGLWVKNDYGAYSVRGVDLTLHEGEILGVAGIAGNGQRELFEALIGIREIEKGKIVVGGSSAVVGKHAAGTSDIAVIPEDRIGWALVPGKSLVFNTAAGMYGSPLGPYRGIRVLWEKARSLTARIVKEMNVITPGLDVPPEALSGGNMQRYIVGRELAKKPRLILSMNPTGGLDVAAARFVHQLLLDAASQGVGILLFSEDLDELIELADRILVMNRGTIVYESLRPFDVREIARRMTV
ncbi:MAG: heme ABC transporter ATP-binding protein [Hyperthermus sp.]|nr:MAG: heme ABC transporter ATP-binding protein [Hyperthermus sp.]